MSQIPSKIRAEVWRKSGRLCEVRLKGCQFQATEIHHKKMRSRMGSHSLQNLVAICSYCHKQVTDNKPGTERWRTHAWQKEGENE